ncbi:MAG TPA: isocitrate/isopropylmalate dehydrogenase family protein, partial [Thermodesulfobacteriota bacterium]|nr:isocitrate/isopropylmalate dehydrogenase family protein [Thermodesulfobacteriota bacterium]
DWLADRHSDPQSQKGAKAIESAMSEVLKDPRYHTPDLGGRATTAIVGEAVAEKIKASANPG